MIISVIIPVYNAEKYIEQCLDSIINQTYKELEIICIDDGSTDQSLSIIETYAKKDSRIICLHKENEGVSLARNLGLDKAKGEYVIFVDGDDWIDEDTCELAIREMKENVDLVMWSYVRERNGDSQKKHIFDQDIYFIDSEVQEKLHRRMIGIVGKELANPENADALCTVWGKLYRRQIIETNQLQFFDIRKIGTYEDGLFNLKYLKYVRNASFLNQYLYHYRRDNVGSVTTAYNDNLHQQTKYLFKLMDGYIQDNHLDDTYCIALKNRISLSLIPLGINVMAMSSGAKEKLKEIKKIITESAYHKAVTELDVSFMPKHWKLFFRFAKKKNIYGIYGLLVAIQVIRGK